MLVQPDQDTPSAQESFLREVNRLTLVASAALKHDMLADIVSQIPLVRDLLPWESRKAVLKCSRQCRSVIHSHVTAVAINTLDDLDAISGSTWPILDVVVVKNQRMTSAVGDVIAQCELQVLAVFDLFEETLDVHMVLILKSSLDQQCRDLGIKRHLETLSRIMHAVRSAGRHTPWHVDLFSFALRQSQLDSASLAQLFSMSWPKLMSLDLLHTALDAAVLSALAEGSWPRLQSLSLHRRTLNSIAIVQLTPELWPALKRLRFRGTSSAVPDASLAAFVAAWPNVSQLCLQDMQLSAEFFPALARKRAGLDTLLRLCLHSVILDAKTLSSFKLASWPLVSLRLQNSGLGADAMKVLALCSFPELHELNLSHNVLDDAAAQQLIVGRWLCLRSLDVSHNALDNRAMEALPKGQWPELACLRLQGNLIDAVGIAMLVKGHWSRLLDLQLDLMAVSAATWALLSLDPALLEHHAEWYQLSRFLNGAPRKCLLWRNLDSVTFGGST